MTDFPDLGVILRSSGVAVVLDFSGGRLPVIAHWGADLGDVGADEYTSLLATAVAPIGASEADVPVPVSVLPEHTRGWLGHPGISGSRAGTAWSPSFTVTSVAINERQIGEDDARVINSGAAVVVVAATDAVTQLGLEVTIELDPAGVVRMRAEMENLAEEPYQLDEMLLCLPTPLQADEVLDFAGRWGRERAPQRHRMTVGTHRREGRRGRTGLDAATILSAGTPGFGFAGGEVWGIHTAWSGNHVHQLERALSGRQLLGGGELLLPGELRLAQGETYRSPWVYGFYGDGLDAAAQRTHRMLRARPQHPSTVRPITLNVWEAVYFDHDFDTLVELADLAAGVGIERFVLDDGWFGGRRNDRAGLGDWTVSPDVWPHGLGPLIDHVRGLDMEFGLWVEPEMINVDSDLARQHPEWIMSARDRLPVEARNQQVLDLGNPDCYAHIRDALVALLDEYDIAYLKWDHNRDLVDAGSGAAQRPGVHGQTLAFYRLVDELKAKYPGLEIESCSSGGGRVDLGALDRTDRIWVSDNNDPLDRQEINRWTSQLVPPELMGMHIASESSHTTGRTHALSFRATTALFGHLGVEWDLRTSTAAELAELGAWIGLHRELRELLHGGDLVRLDHPDDSISLHGVVATDRSDAVYAFVAHTRSPLANAGRVRLPGLDPQRSYTVEPVRVGVQPEDSDLPAWWSTGATATGALLGSVGVVMPTLWPEHSVLLRVVEREGGPARDIRP
ncbi:alpha-galactosidase [Microbacterium sp. Root61]|uniref:alpha-galactosidase n=1 Tax=Microbacterium sp. Root61 TaxID=1736570 RepID=UPI000700DD34|nr:alpha-galactosidase [Microbacterium sp. Root61]KRA24147.1 alpha-galactosidase [Microbacterium sp. Root61]